MHAFSAAASPRFGTDVAAMDLAAVYEGLFWTVVGVSAATGISNLGLKGDGLLGPETAWGTALAVKLTLVLGLLALSAVRKSGLGLFVLFWATTSIATRLGLGQLGGGPGLESASHGAVILTTVVAGAWNGLFVFAGVVLVVLAQFVATRGIDAILTIAPVLMASAMGAAVALALGGIAGLAYGLVDALLLSAGRALHAWASSA